MATFIDNTVIKTIMERIIECSQARGNIDARGKVMVRDRGSFVKVCHQIGTQCVRYLWLSTFFMEIKLVECHIQVMLKDMYHVSQTFMTCLDIPTLLEANGVAGRDTMWQCVSYLVVLGTWCVLVDTQYTTCVSDISDTLPP